MGDNIALAALIFYRSKFAGAARTIMSNIDDLGTDAIQKALGESTDAIQKEIMAKLQFTFAKIESEFQVNYQTRELVIRHEMSLCDVSNHPRPDNAGMIIQMNMRNSKITYLPEEL